MLPSRRQPARKVKKQPTPYKTNAWSSEVVNKVFDTTELLENIFLHLDARSVLKAQQVNRTFRNVVNGSIKIKKAIGLIPDEQANFRFPLWPGRDQNFQGLDCYLDIGNDVFSKDYDPDLPGASSTWSTGVHILLSEECHDEIFKPMGSRCRSLSICQPPLKSITIQGTECKSTGARLAIRNWNVTTDAGYVTMGDLQDLTKRMIKDHHALCKCTSRPCVDSVELGGVVELREDDAAVMYQKKLAEEQERQEQERQEQERQWQEGEDAEAPSP